jgi:uncharacterized protein YhjY with autotransporter beta-barrel domain
VLWSVAASAQVFTLTLQPNTVPSGTENTPYSQLITAVGGNAPYTFAVTSGALPPGIVLETDGLLHGTPTTPNSYTFTITATDSTANTGFRPYTFSIGTQGGLTIDPPTLPAGSQGVAYSQTLIASGGSGGYVFSISAGALPPGLSLASGGAITGTPSAGGTFNFTAFVQDSNGNTGTRAYALNIGTNSLTVSPPTLPNGTQGVAYSQTVSASGGTGPYTFLVSGGALPNGLALDGNTGAITGTPTVPGPFSFTIRATDSINNVGSQTYNVNIGTNILTVNPATLPGGTIGTAYNQTVTASGGTGGYTFAVTSGALPTGLALSSGGALTGTPSASGPFNFTIEATDSSANTGSRAYAVTIGAAPLTVNPATLPNGQQGTAYNQTIVASGGVGPYSYAVLSGSLPTGLSLDPGTGAITGTPSAGGTFNFTIQATDAQPSTGTRAYTVNIGTNSLTVNPASLPNGTQGVGYNQTVVASGGTGPYTYAVSAGALPAGLSLNVNSGAITGTPSGSGPSAFTIRATDSLNNFGSRAYNINIGTNSLTINPATLPGSVTGRPYSATVVASGGTGPYTYSVSAGALPPGLTLNPASGLISGTMTAQGAFAFTISALDSLGNAGSRAYSLASRRDPALDPEVIGLVNAQVAAARRFASAQIDNISRHLERLHNFNPCSVEFGVNLPMPADTKQLYPGGSPYSPSPGNAARSYDAPPNSPAAQVARRMPGPQECTENDGRRSSLAAWMSGSVQFGSVMPDGSAGSGRFTTAGLTAGIDWRVHSDLIVGAAVGFGNDRSTVGSFGTASSSTSVSGALYASYSAFDPWFIDATIGYGQLGYDNRRFVTDDATTVNGSRKGSYWFGAATVGYEFKYHTLHLSPYVRADFMSAQLNSYSETGGSSQLLTFDAMKFHSVGGTVGLRGSYDIPMRWGVLTPNARVEFRQTIDGAFQQSMHYSDIGPAVSSTLIQAGAASGTLNTSLGVRARSRQGVSGELEYGTSGGSGKVQSQSVRAALKVAF